MSNILTQVKIALDSKDLEEAQSKANDMGVELGTVVSTAKKFGPQIMAAVAAIASAKIAIDGLNANFEKVLGRAQDFENTMSDDVRGAILAINEEAEEGFENINALSESIALSWGGIVNDVKGAVDSAIEWTGIADPEDVKEKAKKVEAEVKKSHDAMYLTGKERVEAERRLREIDIELAQNQFDEAAGELGRLEKELALELERIDLESKMVRNQADREFYEGQVALAKLRYESSIKFINKEKEDAAKAEKEKSDQAAAAAKKRSDEEAARRQKEYEKGKEQAQTEFEDFLAMRQGEDAVLELQLERDLERVRIQTEKEYLTVEQANEKRLALMAQYNEDIEALNTELVEKNKETVEKSLESVNSLSQSMFGMISREAEQLYNTLNNLISVFQDMGWLKSSGGIWGALGSIGGAAGGASGASGLAGASTFNGGVSVGTLALTVNGGNGSTAEAARRGVYDGLQSLVKQQMSIETKFGGILNPSSGVTKV